MPILGQLGGVRTEGLLFSGRHPIEARSTTADSRGANQGSSGYEVHLLQKLLNPKVEELGRGRRQGERKGPEVLCSHTQPCTSFTGGQAGTARTRQQQTQVESQQLFTVPNKSPQK